MVMPLYDDAPLRHLKRPVVNHALIAINVLVFLIVQSELLGDPLTIMRGFAIIPRVLFGEANLADWVVGPPPAATLVTSLFFHSSALHLLSNMLFLYVFGDNIEDRCGHSRFVLFYLLAGAAAAATQVAVNPASEMPMVGASGAIAGVLGAYVILFPRARVLTLLPIFIFFQLIELPAYVFLGLWFLMQIASGALSLRIGADAGGVAWWAHIGGFLSGALFLPFLRRAR
jgi:membrane associated rhomboid family serine protease